MAGSSWHPEATVSQPGFQHLYAQTHYRRLVRSVHAIVAGLIFVASFRDDSWVLTRASMIAPRVRQAKQYDELGNEVEFDVREDEEKDVKLRETVQLLLAAGYFRARIKGLSAFDKVSRGSAARQRAADLRLVGLSVI